MTLFAISIGLTCAAALAVVHELVWAIVGDDTSSSDSSGSDTGRTLGRPGTPPEGR